MSKVRLRYLGLRDYGPVWQTMRAFTDMREAATPDELWLVEHPPVFTQGMNGRAEHILDAGPIPVVQVDRGGQATYHGPGQVVLYILADLGRLKVGPRGLVNALEQAAVALLADMGIAAQADARAPGVYIEGRKIAAIGLRVRRGCSYHGMSLNVAMDLTPFTRINPCGQARLEITQLADLGLALTWTEVAQRLGAHAVEQLGYTEVIFE